MPSEQPMTPSKFFSEAHLLLMRWYDPDGEISHKDVEEFEQAILDLTVRYFDEYAK